MSKRDHRLYLTEIIESGEAIHGYVKNYSLDDFYQSRKTYSAVIREFEIIGEAVGKLPNNIKQQHPNVPWQDIKDFRNMLAHHYFGIDLEIVWQVIHAELPTLISATKELLD